MKRNKQQTVIFWTGSFRYWVKRAGEHKARTEGRRGCVRSARTAMRMILLEMKYA